MLIGGWVNLCDAKKLNFKYQFIEGKIIPNVENWKKVQLQAKNFF